MENKRFIKDSSMVTKAFNNPDCSDVVFIVNDTKYYAYRRFIAGASTFFQTLLVGEFKESSQKEIALNNVMTYDSNFLIILKFIYGFEIDLKEFCNLQLCELFHLTEYFDLASLKEQVQNYLDSLDFSDIEFESVTVLINLAYHTSLKQLYKTAETFIFANVEHFLTHSSYLELEYDVLKGLLKSDSFYAEEFNIFMAVLEWNAVNSTGGVLTMSGTSVDSGEFAVPEDVDEKEKDSPKNNKVPENSYPDLSKDEDIENPRKLNSKDEGLGDSSSISANNEDFKLVELLKDVRNNKMNLHSLYKVLENKEKANLLKHVPLMCMITSQVKNIDCLPRKYELVFFHVTIHNIKQINEGRIKTGNYLIKNMKWRLKVSWSKQTNGINVFLKCSSEHENWTCCADFDISVVKNNGTRCESHFFDGENFSFSQDNPDTSKVPLIPLGEAIRSYLNPDGSLKIRVTIDPKDP